MKSSKYTKILMKSNKSKFSPFYVAIILFQLAIPQKLKGKAKILLFVTLAEFLQALKISLLLYQEIK